MDSNDINYTRIVAYLLGTASDTETLMFDELTVTDPDLAARVDAAERDLVDEYVRDELDPEIREQFENAYLTSPLRREKVRFAKSFEEYLVDVQRSVHQIRADTEVESKRAWPTFWWKFGAAAFASAILIAIAIPLWYNSGTERAGVTPENRSSASTPNDKNVAQSDPTPLVPAISQVPDPRTAPPDNTERAVKDPEIEQKQPTMTGRVFAVTFFPQTRGPGSEKRITLPTAADRIAVTLQLEPTDFPTVRVELKDRSSGSVIWQGRARPSRSSGAYQSLKFEIPRGRFVGGSYTFTAFGITKDLPQEIIGDYPFTVVR